MKFIQSALVIAVLFATTEAIQLDSIEERHCHKGDDPCEVVKENEDKHK